MFLVLLMLLSLLALLLLAAVLLALALLRPPRMTDAKALHVLQRLSPADLGMHYQTVPFSIRDRSTGKPMRIMSWWIPHPAGGDKTVVLIHGYADAKVGAIAWAPTWQQLGYHLLAIDLRAHGQSDGRYTTAGYFERHDLDQVLDQLRAMCPQQTSGQLVLFGASLGAAVALATAAMRNDIAALVLECPFASYRNTLKAHLRAFDFPVPWVLPLAIRIGQWISGAKLEAIDPLRLLAEVPCPVLVIQSRQDQFVSEADIRAIEMTIHNRPSALGPGVFWLTESPHLLSLHADPMQYHLRIAGFLTACQEHRIAVTQPLF
ncbi:alpha/beta hydrolase [Fontivita pretiosa]|uniref:alpha/beta hydrolase n=1 Tax=Fontivita pretiosa TaxID=2989684 RepID=UPI003D17C736